MTIRLWCASVAALALGTSACWTSRTMLRDPVTFSEVSSGPSRPSVRPSRCEMVVGDSMAAEIEKAAQFGFEGMVLRVRDAAVASCREMAWSAELLDCYVEEPAEPLTVCETFMTMEQRQHYDLSVKAAMAGERFAGP